MKFIVTIDDQEINDHCKRKGISIPDSAILYFLEDIFPSVEVELK